MYKYLIYLPKTFDKAREYPLLFFLHGAPQRGDDLKKVKNVALSYELENDNLDLDFIVVAPQCPYLESWQPEKLYKLFVEIYSTYSVDLKRVYLTGFSMGGFGSIKFAKEYPKIFAAVAPVCSGGSSFVAQDIKNIPFWFFHGKKDEIIGFEKTEELFNELMKLNADVKLTAYENLGHDVWTITYKNPRLYYWFLSHHL